MSGQIADEIRVGKIELTIINDDNRFGFSPKKYGIRPKSICSNCMRGYWCVYSISDNNIFLEDLHIHSYNGNYPPIAGVEPLPEEAWSSYSYRHYKGLHLKLDYTGKILVGYKFLEEYYIHTIFQWPWAYENVAELVFENGHSVKAIDRSKIVADIRERIDNSKELTQKTMFGMPELVKAEDFVSPELASELWWLHKW